MHTMTRVLFVALLTCSLVRQQEVLSGQTLEFRFGILVIAQDGTEQFIETKEVPNVEGQGYGWIGMIAANPRPIAWSEELTLPVPPRVWDGPSRDAISVDRKTAVTRGTIAPNGESFYNFWSVEPGDPLGTYKITIRVDDGVVAEFKFDLVSPR